ncbi:hypothetical protein GCM10017608_15130 [Agromyces luteolus]|uniref:hypothetical protein n=1 Tax=Agromyces luteolus TaxID=88373 RepID=UPI00197ABB61|nr:hypothetical protein [Agromyces luteolus]GLK27579.1 hypothetical protein GCM10017608_15130 [Agromyces luteolus]
MPDFGEPGGDADGTALATPANPDGRRARDARPLDEGAVVERDRWAMRASAHPGRRPRRREAIAFDPADHQDPDRRRYFLSSLQPSGDYEAVIVAITDGASRRYFSSRDGSHFIEVDELSFEQRRKSGSRSMLEIGEHELRELEGALIFVRPLDGRDPIAEVAAARKASLEATRPMAIVPIAHRPPVAETDGAPASAEPRADAAAGGPGDDPGLGWADEPAEAADESSEPDAPGPRRSTFEPIPPGDAGDPSSSAATEASVADVADTIEDVADAIELAAISLSPDEAAEPEPEPEPEPGPLHEHAPAPGPSAQQPAAPRSRARLSPLEAVAQVALAKGIAFAAHRGQLDKSGTPYIDHPGRIAERFDPVTDPIAAAAAWLHDVLEDTPLTSRELFEAGVLLEVVGVVELLTRRPEVTPDEYYARIRRHPVALRVKLADIDDNTAPWRLRRLDFAKQQRLAEKYRHARRVLGVE